MDAQRIAPKLWMGSYPDGPVPGVDVLVLCAEELQHHAHHAVLRVPLDDARPTDHEVALAKRAALRVNALRRQGKRVLVTCAMGINRSGLVTALALVFDGHSGEEAIRAVRQGRKHPSGMLALRNPYFCQVILSASRANSSVHA